MASPVISKSGTYIADGSSAWCVGRNKRMTLSFYVKTAIQITNNVNVTVFQLPTNIKSASNYYGIGFVQTSGVPICNGNIC